MFIGIHLPLCLSKCPLETYSNYCDINNTKEKKKREKGRV